MRAPQALHAQYPPVSVPYHLQPNPDVDTIYMSAAQSMGVSGGWPLNVRSSLLHELSHLVFDVLRVCAQQVFVTPELKPFFAGYHYHPNRSQFLFRVD